MGAIGAAGAAITLLLVLSPSLSAAQSDLEKARALYNAGQFDESIAAATAAKGKPAAAASATLIAARARLERFRLNGNADDLTAARADLISLNPHNLAPQEAIEWQIGLGTTLFLENQPGPAAEMFTVVLPSARGRLSTEEFDKLLEWWASTMSLVAEALTGDARTHAYAAMRSTVRSELETNPFSRPAIYWSVVALRGTGDLDGAWNAAVAGWVRAGSEPEATRLRTDLERFVTQTLIPERAQARTGERLDASSTTIVIASMTDQWRGVIGSWK